MKIKIGILCKCFVVLSWLKTSIVLIGQEMNILKKFCTLCWSFFWSRMNPEKRILNIQLSVDRFNLKKTFKSLTTSLAKTTQLYKSKFIIKHPKNILSQPSNKKGSPNPIKKASN